MKKKSVVAPRYINPRLQGKFIPDPRDLSAMVKDVGVPVEVGVGVIPHDFDFLLKLADALQSTSKLALQVFNSRGANTQELRTKSDQRSN